MSYMVLLRLLHSCQCKDEFEKGDCQQDDLDVVEYLKNLTLLSFGATALFFLEAADIHEDDRDEYYI